MFTTPFEQVPLKREESCEVVQVVGKQLQRPNELINQARKSLFVSNALYIGPAVKSQSANNLNVFDVTRKMDCGVCHSDETLFDLKILGYGLNYHSHCGASNESPVLDYQASKLTS